ncbi:MAG: S1 RNA-binding domain-containing protein [Isosphaeraceae bacterium]
MVDRNLINDFDVSEDELEAFVGSDSMGMDDLQVGSPSFDIGTIVTGRVISVDGDRVIVDIGFKAEGLVPLNEWEDEAPPQPGDEVEVLLEDMEDETSEVHLSRRKAFAFLIK